jgi:hypothetical protein
VAGALGRVCSGSESGGAGSWPHTVVVGSSRGSVPTALVAWRAAAGLLWPGLTAVLLKQVLLLGFVGLLECAEIGLHRHLRIHHHVSVRAQVPDEIGAQPPPGRPISVCEAG